MQPPLGPVVGNRVFKQHGARVPGPIAKQASRRGVIKGSGASVAPTLFYYLQVNAGIAFEEAEALVDAKRLLVSGRPVANIDGLSVQVPLAMLDDMDVSILKPDGSAVKAADRAAHRFYGLMRYGSRTRLVDDEADPRSYRYKCDGLAPAVPRLLRCHFGFGVSGVGILTTDVSDVSHFNPDLGFRARYAVDMHPGAPVDVRDGFVRNLPAVLRAEFPAAGGVTVEPRGDRAFAIDTPWLSFDVLQQIRDTDPVSIVCTQCGPFPLPEDLAEGEYRPFTAAELDTYRAYVRKLVMRRLVLSLRDASEATAAL